VTEENALILAIVAKNEDDRSPHGLDQIKGARTVWQQCTYDTCSLASNSVKCITL